MTDGPSSPEATQRLDKWLWCARFFKSRTLANKMVGSGKLRLSEKVISKAHQVVRSGDILTFPQGPHIRVVKVLATATRRGPAPEAQLLYEDLSPIEKSGKPKKTEGKSRIAKRDDGAGRPTKRDRRLTDRLKDV